MAEYEAFLADQSEHIKLLCIDRLNKSDHVSNVGGVIPFRPMSSPILCRQQIGRARATGNAEAPLIPDIGNPFDGMTGNGIIRRQLASCRDAGHGAEKKPNCRGKRETTAAEA